MQKERPAFAGLQRRALQRLCGAGLLSPPGALFSGMGGFLLSGLLFLLGSVLCLQSLLLMVYHLTP